MTDKRKREEDTAALGIKKTKLVSTIDSTPVQVRGYLQYVSSNMQVYILYISALFSFELNSLPIGFF